MKVDFLETYHTSSTGYIWDADSIIVVPNSIQLEPETNIGRKK